MMDDCELRVERERERLYTKRIKCNCIFRLSGLNLSNTYIIFNFFAYKLYLMFCFAFRPFFRQLLLFPPFVIVKIIEPH